MKRKRVEEKKTPWYGLVSGPFHQRREKALTNSVMDAICLPFHLVSLVIEYEEPLYFTLKHYKDFSARVEEQWSNMLRAFNEETWSSMSASRKQRNISPL